MAVDTRILAGVVASACPSMSTVRGGTPSPAKLSLRPRWRSVIPPPPRLHSAQPMVVGTLRIGSLGAGVGGTDREAVRRLETNRVVADVAALGEEDRDGFRGVMGSVCAVAELDDGWRI